MAEPLRIGAKLKHTRLMLGMSLAEVGKQTELTEGYISKLENNRAQASMSALHRVAAALGMNMSELFATDDDATGPVSIVRKDSRPKLVTGHLRAGNQVTLEKLVPGSSGQLLQINIHVIAPGGGSLEPISHDGQEFGFVLTGSIELIVDQHVVEVSEGDSFYFDSYLPHGYRNVGQTEARVLWVNTPPTF
ncbi:cupin domain-containing protein [Mesorhizobium sp. M7A.F.Ca.US.006.01.1.1]|nr:cupin domain-containing protein [Mesorhizobium sp. M7A.F.Ca.US.006.01.1.1]